MDDDDRRRRSNWPFTSARRQRARTSPPAAPLLIYRHHRASRGPAAARSRRPCYIRVSLAASRRCRVPPAAVYGEPAAKLGRPAGHEAGRDARIATVTSYSRMLLLLPPALRDAAEKIGLRTSTGCTGLPTLANLTTSSVQRIRSPSLEAAPTALAQLAQFSVRCLS